MEHRDEEESVDVVVGTDVPATVDVIRAPAARLNAEAWLSSMRPTSFAEAQAIATMLAESTFVPEVFDNKPGDVLAAIAYGAEIGLPALQSLNGICVINGRPSIWGDLGLALIYASGLLEDISETRSGEGDEFVARCVMKRRGIPTPYDHTFSMRDAIAAGLKEKTDPWKKYPKRQCQMRARGFASRDGFADVLRGLYFREEALDIAKMEGAALDITPRPIGHTGDVAAHPGGEAIVDDNKRRALLAECGKNKKDHADLKAWLATQGVQSTTKIPVALFDKAMAWAKEPKS